MTIDTAQALVDCLALKDFATAAHTWRVTLYARALAERLGASHDEADRVALAAAVHDLGKVDVPDAILRKPDVLTSDELVIMRTHAALGHERLLAMGEEDPLVLAITRSHHERLDGSGYPDGLVGTSVPMLVRAFAVVDTFDALTSYRPYRSEVGHEAAKAALAELGERSGTWYDDAAVRALGSMFEAGELTWIMEHHNRQEPLGFPRLPDHPPRAT